MKTNKYTRDTLNILFCIAIIIVVVNVLIYGMLDHNTRVTNDFNNYYKSGTCMMNNCRLTNVTDPVTVKYLLHYDLTLCNNLLEQETCLINVDGNHNTRYNITYYVNTNNKPICNSKQTCYYYTLDTSNTLSRHDIYSINNEYSRNNMSAKYLTWFTSVTIVAIVIMILIMLCRYPKSSDDTTETELEDVRSTSIINKQG